MRWVVSSGMLASESLESEVERSARQPVYFDVVGLLVVSARAPAALLAAALALALAALLVQRTAAAASRERMCACTCATRCYLLHSLLSKQLSFPDAPGSRRFLIIVRHVLGKQAANLSNVQQPSTYRDNFRF